MSKGEEDFRDLLDNLIGLGESFHLFLSYGSWHCHVTFKTPKGTSVEIKSGSQDSMVDALIYVESEAELLGAFKFKAVASPTTIDHDEIPF